MPHRLLPALAVLAGLVFAGCASVATDAKIHPAALQLPPGNKVPLRVGILVSGPTMAYRCHAKIPLGEWIYPFGRDLPAVALETFRQVADSVALIDAPDYQSFDLVLEPSFDESRTAAEIGFSSAHTLIAMNFKASNASGVRWSKSTTGELSTGGTYPDIETHGQAVSKAVAAAAEAFRAEMASMKPRAAAPAPGQAAPAGEWWAK